MARGAAPGTRRLVVGRQDDSAREPRGLGRGHADAGAQVEAEARHLDELRQLVRPTLTRSLPAVVARVEVSGRPGVVLSAVAGVGPRARARARGVRGRDQPRPHVADHDLVGHVEQSRAPVDFGSQAYDVLLARFAGSRRAAATLGALQRSRAALADRQTARTVSHGCLCPRHVRVGDGGAVGADDWGRAAFDADPLRDLGQLGGPSGWRTASKASSRDGPDTAGRCGTSWRAAWPSGASPRACGATCSCWRSRRLRSRDSRSRTRRRWIG